MRRKFHQLEFQFRQHGGKRKGAGRKPKNDEPGMPHRQRAKKKRTEALHVIVSLVEGLPSLRRGGALKLVLAAVSASSNPHGVRIVHYSNQRDHLHLLVEADDRECVARGMNAGRYVLQSGKKRGVVAQSSIDLCSSALVFNGWMERSSIAAISAASLVAIVAPASNWLLATGWRRYGLLDIRELPRLNKPAGRPRRNPAQSSRRTTSR